MVLDCSIKLVHYNIQMSTKVQNGKPVFGFRLDLHSGVPVYRQLIDQVMGGMAAGALKGGDQLPTVRQVAVDLAINPNTVLRAYRELEIRGVLETQQGTGTFVSHRKVEHNEVERQRQLNQLVSEFVARAGAAGFTVAELLEQLHERGSDSEGKRR
jgi:GntR family transcriptional regulator